MDSEELEVLKQISVSLNDINVKTDKMILLLKKVVEKTEGM